MNQTKLGATRLTLSPIGLGIMRIESKSSDQEAAAIVTASGHCSPFIESATLNVQRTS